METPTPSPLGIYIHIPFCRQKCDYCGFYSVPVGNMGPHERDTLLKGYAEKLCEEIERKSATLEGFMADTVYFGGGTPSLLEPESAAVVMDRLRAAFPCDASGREVTLECNPEDFSAKKMSGYVEAGVNRVVLGVQTLNGRLRRTIGRAGPLCDQALLDAFFSAQGFTRCIDIIAGIPGQKKEQLSEEVEVLAGYRPEHVSAYMLGVEKGTPLHGRISLPVRFEAGQKALFTTVIDRLTARGYRHYEVSNFALPGHESRHNMKYWRFMPYAGFGAGAHSFIRGERYFNSPDVDGYMGGRESRIIRDERSPGAAAAEYIMTGLRLMEGISLNDYREKAGMSVDERLMLKLRDHEKRGLIQIEESGDDRRVRITRKGFYVIDAVVYGLVEHLL
jgi:oxygen-independent coproporphyrinogen III oxidase